MVSEFDAKVVRYTSLQANLMFLADTGRSAFLEAEGRMEVLRENSRYLFSETGPVSIRTFVSGSTSLVTNARTNL